jgi:hypothetical protein
MRRSSWFLSTAVGGIAVVAIGIGALMSSAGGPEATPSAAGATETSTAPSRNGENSTGTLRPALTIGPDDSAAQLAMEHDGRRQHPVGGFEGRVLILSERDVWPAPGQPVPQFPTQTDQQFLLWDPETGDSTLAWARTDRFREMVLGTEGEWVLSLPYRGNLGEWRIVLRNLGTGETRAVATRDERFAAANSAPPLGEYQAAHWGDLTGDGLPVIGGGHAAWVQTVIDDAGGVRQQVLVHEIASNTTRPVFEIAEPRKLDEQGEWTSGGHAWSASVGGGKVAWVVQESPAARGVLYLHDLADGSTTQVDLPQEPKGVAVSGSGDALAVSVGAAVLVVDVETGEVSPLAGIPAIPAPHRLHFQGDYLWWGPPSPTPQVAGVVDLGNGQVWMTASPTHNALLAGEWFTWQERSPGEEPGVYHFVPLP